MPDPSQVLVVDDHPRMVALIQRWLRRAGYAVTGVTTVSEALAVLSTQPLAWVLTDLLLPTGDGMDVLVYARQQQPQAKVILMTAFGSDATHQRAVAHGAHAFLSKPFRAEALFAILNPQPPSEPTPPAAGDDHHGS